tara:strand:+ start:220 stop:705 length:486 start_codon:yes stop_codon:yes gene_type:complete
LKNIKLLKSQDITLIQEFINNNKNDFLYFKNIGWNNITIKNQLNKNNNLSLGYFDNKVLVGLLFGEIIDLQSHSILEIHVLLVTKQFRRKKIATKILDFFEKKNKFPQISMLLIEVAEDNLGAIKFYIKNSFVYYNFRPNYYKYDNKLINAKCFKKNINHE